MSACVKCPLGYSAGSTGSESCMQCAAGQYADKVGLQSCKECPTGTSLGTTSGVECIACAPGYFTPDTGRTSCDDCPTGYYQVLARSTQCSMCEPGRFQTIRAAEDCEFCPAGWFQGGRAQQDCTMCYERTYMGCKGGYRCWDCEIGRTSSPKVGGTMCVAETVVTSVPEIVVGSHIYAGSDGGEEEGEEDPKVLSRVMRMDNSRMCITWRMKNAAERAKDGGGENLPWIFAEGFLIEWSLEQGFPPKNEEDLVSRVKTNSTVFNHRGSDFDVSAAGNRSVANALLGLGAPPDLSMYGTEEFNLGPWTECINTSLPVHMEQIYVRVLGISPVNNLNGDVAFGALGSPSQPTPPYATAPSCGDVMYLSQHSWPPDGPGLWEIAGFNRRLEHWRCEACPEGGDCRGPKLWYETYAKYGYMRLGQEDFDNRKTAFWPCFKQKACLGGKIALATNDKPGKKHGYTSYVRPAVDCCSAVDPLEEDLEKCKQDPLTFHSAYEASWVGDSYDGGFEPAKRGCLVDLALVDDYEACHAEAGYRINCSNTRSGKCRLCRACAPGYWPQGVSNCLRCPHWILNIILVVLAVGFVMMMLIMFLSSALQDSGAEADSTVIHFSQAQQKILLNHIQLISLASGFPLKWPDEVQSMFEAMSLLGNAGSYVFNPACSDAELVPGESMFFQKQLGILLLPFIAVICCSIFWCLAGARNCCDPPEKRRQRVLRKRAKMEKRALERKRKNHHKRFKRLSIERQKQDQKALRKQTVQPLQAGHTNDMDNSGFGLNGVGDIVDAQPPSDILIKEYPKANAKKKTEKKKKKKTTTTSNRNMKKKSAEKTPKKSVNGDGAKPQQAEPKKTKSKEDRSKKRDNPLSEKPAEETDAKKQKKEKTKKGNKKTKKKKTEDLPNKNSTGDTAAEKQAKGAEPGSKDTGKSEKVQNDSLGEPMERFKTENTSKHEQASQKGRGADNLTADAGVSIVATEDGSSAATNDGNTAGGDNIIVPKLSSLSPNDEPSAPTPRNQADGVNDDVVGADASGGSDRSISPAAALRMRVQLRELAERQMHRTIGRTNTWTRAYRHEEKAEVDARGSQAGLSGGRSILEKPPPQDPGPATIAKNNGTHEQMAMYLREKWSHLEQAQAHLDAHLVSATSANGEKSKEGSTKPKSELDAHHDKLASASAAMAEQDGVSQSTDGIGDPVIVTRMTVHPLVPLGIEWASTHRAKLEEKRTASGKRKRRFSLLSRTKSVMKGDASLINSFGGLAVDGLEMKYIMKIKRLRGTRTQAQLMHLEEGDYLQTFAGLPVTNMRFGDVEQLFADAEALGQPYVLTFVRKVHGFRDRIQNRVKEGMLANQRSIRTWDKFIATLVTMLYLLYPTVTRGTFQLVACQRVGGRMYLQMDLDIACYEPAHLFWVLNLFVPCALGYVIGLPLVTLMILIPRRHDLNNRFTKFRFGVLYTGYTEKCYYWESVIAARKATVITVSVFLTQAGPESQALCGMMIIMVGTVLHLFMKPFAQVTADHNTLFWTEFWGLQTAFITFWTGLFFFQDVAQDPDIQLFFTIELLTVNFVFLLVAVRWFFILKLMDLDDMISTKQLQGYSGDDLRSEICMKRALSRFFPEWQYVKNLWARRAWQSSARKAILKHRVHAAISTKAGSRRIGGHDDRLYTLGTTSDLHNSAVASLGLAVKGVNLKDKNYKKQQDQARKTEKKRLAKLRRQRNKRGGHGAHRKNRDVESAEEKRARRRTLLQQMQLRADGLSEEDQWASRADSSRRLMELSHRQKAMENLEESIQTRSEHDLRQKEKQVDSRKRLTERLLKRSTTKHARLQRKGSLR